VLSRIAESLYWTGRYLERAEDTTRLLEVQINRLLEGAGLEQAAVTEVILQVMGIDLPEDEPRDLGSVSALLSASSQPSSIASSLRGARENARGIRESISSELWECLNATIVALDAHLVDAPVVGPHEFFRFARFARERVAIAAGIADGTMSRDDGWQFLVLGRSLERVDMTVRLLQSQLGAPTLEVEWSTTLRACSAYEAYLRNYRGVLRAEHALEFLLLDRFFPRSIYFCLNEAENCLEALGGRRALGDTPRQIIGRARAEFAYRSVAEVLARVPEHLTEVQEACAEASAAIATNYFQREATLAWRTEDSPRPMRAGA
jgi:uncharacterized alpha-E superfamily protein